MSTAPDCKMDQPTSQPQQQQTQQQVLPRSRPRSSQTTVSVNWDDADGLSPHPRMKFEVAECIETRTVTTTTTTKRSYPPMFVREPRPLSSLDSKEYPLAQKPIPPELANFTFDMDEYGALSWPTESDVDHPEVCNTFFCFSPLAPCVPKNPLPIPDPHR
jgi:hypothetical protein